MLDLLNGLGACLFAGVSCGRVRKNILRNEEKSVPLRAIKNTDTSYVVYCR